MTLNDKIVSQVVEKILKVVEPQRIILFGSAATSTMTRDSDIDLLVIERAFRKRTGRKHSFAKSPQRHGYSC